MEVKNVAKLEIFTIFGSKVFGTKIVGIPRRCNDGAMQSEKVRMKGK